MNATQRQSKMGIGTIHVTQIHHVHHAYQKMAIINAHRAQNQTVSLFLSAKKTATNPLVNTKWFSNQILIFYRIISGTRPWTSLYMDGTASKFFFGDLPTLGGNL